ncbi:MAG: ribosome small subunit-dependent GTPase A [Thermoanaerobaculia bacterium]|nr:ribosome small subunit-dependent GTPase A [Thermoanaerobaculia bacterium]
MAKKQKRFKRRGGSKSQLDQRLSKTARELYQGLREEDLEFEEAWDDGGLGASFGRASTPNRRSARSPRASSSGQRDGLDEADVGPTTEGTVYALASGIAWVQDDEGHRHECALPTRLAADQQSSIAVGDRVLWAPVATAHDASDSSSDDLRVVEVLPRRTFLGRPDPLNPRLQRVVAANVDIVVQVASVVRPPLRPALVDRYLIAIQQGHAEPVLCVNKADLLDDSDDPETSRAKAELQLADYRALDLPLVWTSVKSGTGLDELRGLLEGKTAAFVGHSGVGKSSLINALAPEVDAATGAVSQSYGTGRHTTTRSDLYDLGDFRLIDTPGIREMGLWNLDPIALRDYFPEFEDAARSCRFRDCSHLHEPDCVVRRGVEDGDISRRRYETYLRILESLNEP